MILLIFRVCISMLLSVPFAYLSTLSHYLHTYIGPLQPTNLQILNEFGGIFSITAVIGITTLGDGAQLDIDGYMVNITGMMSSSIELYFDSAPFNITFNYNEEYNISIIAANCIGESPPLTDVIAPFGT